MENSNFAEMFSPAASLLQKHIHCLISQSPNLTELVLDGPTTLTPTEIKFVFGNTKEKPNKNNPLECLENASILSKFTELEYISLTYLWTSPAVLRSLERLPMLEENQITKVRRNFVFSDWIMTFPKGHHDRERARLLGLKSVKRDDRSEDERFPSLVTLTIEAPSKDMDRLLTTVVKTNTSTDYTLSFPRGHLLRNLTLTYRTGSHLPIYPNPSLQHSPL